MKIIGHLESKFQKNWEIHFLGAALIKKQI